LPAHALIIAIARKTNDPDYNLYRQGYKILRKVKRLLQTTGINLQHGGGIQEFHRFQNHFSEYRIVVYGGLDCGDIIFDEQGTSEKRINLLYDDVNRHYHLIANLTSAMVKRYVCKGCNKGCRSGVTNKCQETHNDCSTIPPCVYTHVRIRCESFNRTIRTQSCFDKHKTNKLEGKTECEHKKNCANCGSVLDPIHKHEIFKPFCDHCQQNREIGHLCYMKPITNEMPKSDNVLFVFYDFETTQDTKFSDSSSELIPNLVCLQQFCAHCEMQPDISVDCERCGKRRHSF